MKTTKELLLYAFALVGAAIMLFSSCEKEDDDKKVPVLSTKEVTEITPTTAVSGGTITDDRGATVTARGVCWSTSQNPTINDSITEDGIGAGSFTSNISGLEPSTIYYVRAYATNSAGTGYGSTMSFTTTGVVDVDGNVYKTVVIGTQEWMAENLRTTKYNDNTPIPTGHTDEDWGELTTGAYAVYPHAYISGLNSDSEVIEAYGLLYNWHAIEDGNLCPTGWHIPSDEDWTILIDYLGGRSVAGGKLKSTRTVPDAHPRWDSPNTGASDEYGFSALPGGNRWSTDGSFHIVGQGGLWWSSTEHMSSIAWSRIMSSDFGTVTRNQSYKRNGSSVRCIRNLDN